ncbi:TlpA family protein disulfide reductase [Campylobacter sp. JMF_01 NE2]|uniref:TlpA family protein disulfide reductase n=1 Tax=unclassified Campylobacter TaxID=2593542 RepID=UPI0022E9B2BA|nr:MULTISPECIES: TlpA family protein disulfide reductase [unclassified Campylobacter]MDA3052606.1 TlpA family protein disulfide reductase [Campylobacter sp. JMF_03 NE3]MDA3066937.1 TlpA family protein disulfide reductase [Campylobacter sp. JMF_01 NE2]
MRKILTLIFAGLLLCGCNDESAQNAQNSEVAAKFTPFSVGEKFSLKSVVGGEVVIERTNKGFKLAGSDKILMFDIFGTYCEPCKIEAPHLMDYQLKNADNFMMVGLIHFENITDAQVVENFTKKYNAYYFIANDKQNSRIVEQILTDINYRHALSIPFKVVFKDGEYQTLTDINEGDERGKPYYLGMVSTKVIEKDMLRIKNGNAN